MAKASTPLRAVHAKVERRPFEHRRIERVRVVVLRFDQVVEPLRQFGAHVRRGLREVRIENVLQGARFGTDRRFGDGVKPVLARKRHERRETRRTVGTHRAHGPADRRVVPKSVVDPFGDETAVAHAELRIALEKELHQHVRRPVELEDHGECARQFVDDEARDANAARSERGHALFRRLPDGGACRPRSGAPCGGLQAFPCGGASASQRRDAWEIWIRS